MDNILLFKYSTDYALSHLYKNEKPNVSLLQKWIYKAGETALWLRVLAALPEDLGQIPIT